MKLNHSKNLLMTAASLLGVAGMGAVVSLPAAAQSQNPSPSIFNEAPFNRSNRVLAPISPGAAAAGTTDGGERLERTPTQEPMQQNSMPNRSVRQPMSQPGMNSSETIQPATTGGEASQQVQPNDSSTLPSRPVNNGSMMQTRPGTSQSPASTETAPVSSDDPRPDATVTGGSQSGANDSMTIEQRRIYEQRTQTTEVSPGSTVAPSTSPDNSTPSSTTDSQSGAVQGLW